MGRMSDICLAADAVGTGEMAVSQAHGTVKLQFGFVAKAVRSRKPIQSVLFSRGHYQAGMLPGTPNYEWLFIAWIYI